MNQKPRNRKALKTKFSQALNEEVKGLSSVMQAVLIDDLITAFENRFDVLNKAQSKSQSNLECNVMVGVEVLQ
jgi:hypothetical protein